MTNSDFVSEVFGPLAEDQYLWVCNFRAPPDSGEWGGRAYRGTERQAGLIDAATEDNCYFSTAVFSGFVDGSWVRSKGTFYRLGVLVVDDVDPSSIIGGYTYAAQTSAGKWQVGIGLDANDPDCRNLGLVDRVMSALSARGKLGGNDSSGNACVRYARLPFGRNTKPRAAGPWTVQLAEWCPQIRWSLEDACKAVGIELDDLRASVSSVSSASSSVSSVSSKPVDMSSAAGEALSLLTAPLDARSYHDSLRDLAASMVAGGMFPGATVNFLYSLMDLLRPSGPADEVARWAARRAEIPRAVKSAEKFAPPERAPATVTVNLSARRGDDAKETSESSHELVPLDWGTLERTPPEPAVFVVPGWLPLRTTTLLAANGGVGKSNLALQLAVSLASGSDFLGLPVTPSRVLVISAEDEARTVHFRVSNICADAGVALSALADRMVVYDMAAADCVLWGEHGMTKRMQWLADMVERHRADVVIIDNSSDVYAANENDRASVRGFMRALNVIAAECSCAVLLLAHVDKASVRMGAGLDTDSTFSGSTAWNNSARSRWAMVREGEAVVLRHEKCNLGPRQDEMRLEFDSLAKVFRAFGTGPASIADSVLRNSQRAAILRLIGEADSAGQKLSMSATSNNNAFRVLSAAPGFPRIERSAFFALLFELQRERLIEEAHYVNEHRKKFLHVVLTDAGRSRVALGSGAPPLGH